MGRIYSWTFCVSGIVDSTPIFFTFRPVIPLGPGPVIHPWRNFGPGPVQLPSSTPPEPHITIRPILWPGPVQHPSSTPPEPDIPIRPILGPEPVQFPSSTPA
jgi:hypothetical protein